MSSRKFLLGRKWRGWGDIVQTCYKCGMEGNALSNVLLGFWGGGKGGEGGSHFGVTRIRTLTSRTYMQIKVATLGMYVQ